jgi:hypothetical protein
MAGMTFGGRNMTKSGWGRLLSGMVALFGVWQIAAPFVLNFADEQMAMRNAVVTGVLLTLFGALAFFGAGHWSGNTVRVFDGLAAFTGFWLLISPWVLGYQPLVPAFWSAIIVGLLCFIGAGFAAVKQPEGTSIGA